MDEVPGRTDGESAPRSGLAGVFPAPPILIARAHKTILRVFVETGWVRMHKELREHGQGSRSHHGCLLVHMEV